MKVGKGPVVLIGAIVVALILILGSVAVIMRSSPEVSLGSIDIHIENDMCDISVELQYSPNIDTENENLNVILENDTLPVNYSRGISDLVLNEDQFREILDKEEIRMMGKVEVKPLSFWKRTENVDQTLDLSFISDLVDSIEIMNTSFHEGPSGDLMIEFDLTADIEKDVTIEIVRTVAELKAGSTEHDVLIRELVISTDKVGHGVVGMDPSTFLAVALNPSELFIDAWGIQVDFSMDL
ncbi:MAG: hypothetical protein R6V01_08045 [Thermoplasmatota archaeon]